VKKSFVFVALSLSLISLQALAISFGSFDPRTHAMGGVGVASGDASNANYFNPALLAMTQDEDDFSLVIPTIGVGLTDPDKLVDKLDSYDNANYEQALDATINKFNATGSSGNPAGYVTTASEVARASQNLLTAIQNFSNNTLGLDANAGVLIAVPSKTLGVSVAATGRLVASGLINVTSADINLVQSYINVLNCIGALDSGSATLPDVLSCDDSNNIINDTTGAFNNTNTTATLSSSIKLRGAIVKEISVSFARKFSSLDDVAIGITPKSVNVETYDYSVTLETADIDADQGKRSYSDANLDIGAAKNLTEKIKVGLVGKNIFSKEYTTVLGNTVKIEPQLRTGIAYQNDWALIAVDLDLTKNKGVGFTEDTQYIAAGIEFDAFDTFQLRAGYRHNLKSNSNISSGLPSLGIGLSPFGVHIDVSVANNDDELQAGLQLGLKF